jgi:uncharacterized damage-inducible protein DinB
MIHWILNVGSSDLDVLAVWDGFDRPAPLEIRPSSELVRGLEATGQAIQLALDTWSAADLDHAVEWRYGTDLYTYTRQQMIWNLIRHDYHHYGEVALTLGVHGLSVPDF